MDTPFVLFTSFIALVGLQMCVPEKSNSGYEAHINELHWTDSPLLRVIYGISNILGVLFVIGTATYLVFTEHWWYIFVYLIAIPIAKFIAFICYLCLLVVWKKNSSNNLEMFDRIRKQRICGILVIITAIIIFSTNSFK